VFFKFLPVPVITLEGFVKRADEFFFGPAIDTTLHAARIKVDFAQCPGKLDVIGEEVGFKKRLPFNCRQSAEFISKNEKSKD
jgi:hypothetical protein